MVGVTRKHKIKLVETSYSLLQTNDVTTYMYIQHMYSLGKANNHTLTPCNVKNSIRHHSFTWRNPS